MKKNLRFGGVILCVIYCVYYFTSVQKGGWHFMDNADLIIHEAGHFIFAFLGQFMGILGGSLLQVLVPLIFFGYFWKAHQKNSAAVMLLWTAINLFNVAIYAGDAARMQLPLLGGENSIHDWNWLLLETGLVAQAGAVASAINFLGFLAIAGASWTAWAVWSRKDHEMTVDEILQHIR
jgi:hypothetical protein